MTAALAAWFLAIAIFTFLAARDHWAQLQALLRLYPARAEGARFTLALLAAALLLAGALGLLPRGWRRRAFLLLAALPLPILAATSGNVAALGTALGLLAVTGWLGSVAATWLLRPRSRIEAWIVGGALGIALLAGLGYGLGRLGILRWWAIWPLLAGPALFLLLLRPVRCQAGADLRATAAWLRRPSAWPLTRVGGGAVLLSAWWLNLIGALSPEIASDAIRQRLAAAAFFAQEGRLLFRLGLSLSERPGVGELAYAAVLTCGPLQAAKLVNLGVACWCVAGTWALARRLGGRRAGEIAVLALATFPLALALAQTAYSDYFAVLFALAAILALFARPQVTAGGLVTALACLALGLLVKTSFILIATGIIVVLVLRIAWAGRLAVQSGNPYFMLADSLVLALAVFAAYVVRFGSQGPFAAPEYRAGFFLYGGLTALATPLAFSAMGLYARSERDRSHHDIRRLVGGLALLALGAASVTSLLLPILPGYQVAPKSIPLLFLPIGLALTILLRLAPDLAGRYFGRHQHRVPAIVLGDTAEGEAMKQTLHWARAEGYKIVGLLDDDPLARGGPIQGLPVLGDRYAIPRLARRGGVARLLLTGPAAAASTTQEIVAIGEGAGIAIGVAPASPTPGDDPGHRSRQPADPPGTWRGIAIGLLLLLGAVALVGIASARSVPDEARAWLAEQTAAYLRQSDTVRDPLVGRSLVALARSGVDLTLHTERYGEMRDGFAGYLLFGLLPLIALLRPTRQGVALLIGAGVAYLAWFAGVQYLRYSLPLLALFAALGGAACAQAARHAPRGLPAAVAALVVVLGGLGLLGYLNTVLFYPGIVPYNVALGKQSREAFLADHVVAYEVLQLLDADPQAKRALTAYEYPQLYTRVELLPAGYVAGITDEKLLRERLDALEITHIVIARAFLGPGGWDSNLALDEAFLQRNALLVGGGRNAYLYKLVPPGERGRAQPWARGAELLPNGNFEGAENGRPAGWSPAGQPVYDQAGESSRSGRGAIRTTPQNGYFTVVAVRPDTRYLLTHATRAEGPAAFARLQINWLDGAGTIVAVSLEIAPVSARDYHLHSMLATSPPTAVRAAVYAIAQDGAVWFDDVSLRAIADAGAGQPARRGFGPAGPLAWLAPAERLRGSRRSAAAPIGSS